MINVLFIGNPNSIHDYKWIKTIVCSHNVKGFLITENSYSRKHVEKFGDINVKIAFKLNPYSIKNFGRNIKNLWTIKTFIKNQSINIVHVFIGTSQVILPSKIDIPVILTTRGTDVNFTLRGLHKSDKILNKILFKRLKNAYKRVDQITCTSLSQIDVLEKIIPDISNKPLLIRTGVNIDGVLASEKKVFEKSKNRKQVLFIRNIHSNYDPLLSVDAVVHLRKELLLNTHFVFMKGIDYDRVLFERMEKTLQENRVHFTFLDAMPNEKVWQIIKSSDLVVMNPITDGTPNTAIETMAAKKKLIMGYCKYDNDLFNDKTTIFLSKRDAFELSDLIENELKCKRTDRINYAFEIINQLASQEKEMSKVFNLYKKLIKNGTIIKS
ncbi:MAG: hypothetical protein CMP61_09565 [Flavobacteriales bacterium]|nr:hypothetical protein [Flavobacteriales bacterium]|tara:strand:+ start:22267 stop:23412 length:1146 start_codon:yes stop_codon:yes gene_type:complete